MIYMLHSVGNTETNWIYKYLSVKVAHIRNFFEYLVKQGIQTEFVKDLYQDNFIPFSNKIALTFDDGYLDNWVYLFPLLKQYNIKATIFVNPEFVDKRDVIRKRFSNENEISRQDDAIGFLSWKEMIEMEKSGLVDIQSHSMSHTWFYSGSKVLDFFSPKEIQFKEKWDKQYPWISWNENKAQKSFTHNSFAYFSDNIGTPILENGRSLGIKRFFLDEDLLNRMIKYSKDNLEIFKIENWRNILKLKFSEYSANKSIGRFENEDETKKRFWYELKNSKEIIERKLNKKVDIICWPGGAYNEESLKMSEDAGYLASTISSKEANKTFHNKGKKYKRIPRKPLGGNVGYKNKSFGTSYFKNIMQYRHNPTKINSLLQKSEKLIRLVINS